MEIYCTRPHCEQPLNSFVDLNDSELLKTVHQRYCTSCGMPLILDGRYLPWQVLRQGGLGVAFLGCDRRTPGLKRCVIKQLKISPSFSPMQLETATKLFHREAEVLEKLGEHPNVPRLYAFLEVTAPAPPPYSQQKFFYLVQEYIEGQNLHEELRGKGQFTELEVVSVLREVTRILEFIHAQGAIHRDIKPSNIMRNLQGQIYLIDFGAVKQVVAETVRTAGMPEQDLTCIYTPEYAPWEQRQGQAIYPSSDLYTLAVTCLHLLTGQKPQNLIDIETNDWKWRTPELEVSNALADLLDKMLQNRPSDRFQSAREVLDVLDATWGIPFTNNEFSGATSSQSVTYRFSNAEVSTENFSAPSTVPSAPRPENPPAQTPTDLASRSRPLKPLVVGGVVATGLLGMGVFFIPKMFPNMNLGSSSGGMLGEQSSTGDRILLSVEGTKDTDKFKELKRAGVLAIANRNYAKAVTELQAALAANPNSPETRIYLNNALIGDKKSYTIAVSAPISRSLDRASEMLRGFAQAQTEMNQAGDVNEAKIKLKVVDDSDDPKGIEELATAMAKESDILGVVGHSRNDVTLKAANIYGQNKLPFIAPISTANNLTGADKPYIFRTHAKGDAIAQKLVNHLIDKEHKRKVAIFYVPSISSSNEFKMQFAEKLTARGGEVVGSFSFSTFANANASPTSTPASSPSPSVVFDAETDLSKAKAMGAEAMLVLSVGRTNREALKLLKVKSLKYPKLAVYGDTALYSKNTLEAGKEVAGLIMAVPWQESESTPQFSLGAKQLWNTQVNWATATSYNAVKALGTAIKAQEPPSRETVAKLLAKKEFMGASGRLQFVNGEPTERYILVRVANTPTNYKYSSQTGYDFVPID